MGIDKNIGNSMRRASQSPAVTVAAHTLTSTSLSWGTGLSTSCTYRTSSESISCPNHRTHQFLLCVTKPGCLSIYRMNAIHRGGGRSTEFIEESLIDVESLFWLQPEFELFKHVKQFLAIYEFDWWHSI
ncbi:MAG: hypothetical protein M9927_04350 [Anaerolineae bacterium]|nr:hypothetical protein [Anaerolineae bacterium]